MAKVPHNLPPPDLPPHDVQERTDAMQTDVLLVATAGVSLLQGMPWSPVLFPVVVLLKTLFAGTLLGSPLVLTYLASMLASAMTLVVAGIPAAIYERLKGKGKTTPMSLGIWLACTILLVLVPHLLVGPIRS